MIAITTKDLGIKDGMKVILEVFKLDINSDTEVVNIEFRLNYLSSTNVIFKSENYGYTRYNKKTILDQDGITEISPPNMKFDQLRNSQVGQMIIGMIELDINLIQSIETIIDDVMQK